MENSFEGSFTQEETQQVENVQQASVKYAGFWIRVVAYLIDGFILGIVIAPFQYISMWLVEHAGGIGLFFSIYVWLPYVLFPILLSWAYFIFMTHKYQATFGKRFMGVFVQADDSGNATLKKIILRETIGRILSNVVLYIGYIMVAFTERKQALHDEVAGTVVLYRDPNKKVSKWIYVVIIIPILVIIAIVAIIAMVFLNAGKNTKTQPQQLQVQTGFDVSSNSAENIPPQPASDSSVQQTIPTQESAEPQTQPSGENNNQASVSSGTTAVQPAPQTNSVVAIHFTIKDSGGKLLSGILCQVTTNNKSNTKMTTVASKTSDSNGNCFFENLDSTNPYLVRVYWTKDQSRDSMVSLSWIAPGTTLSRTIIKPAGM